MQLFRSTTKRTADAVPCEVSLLGEVARGDRVAFEALYHCYYPRLSRFLQRITRRPHLVEEILNDTMLVVWRKADSYDRSSKVSTWIFAIAFRKALKALKRVDDPTDAEPEEMAIATQAGPEGELSQQQLRVFLNRGMAELSMEHRAVIELTYYQGYAYREIAAIMNCPVDTVKTRMFHARRRLKTLLTCHAEGAEWVDE